MAEAEGEPASPISARRAAAGRASRQIRFSTILALLSAAVLVAVLLSWSSARMDAVSIERQEQLVSQVLGQSAAKLAREQEFLQFKDNAVRLFAKPIVKKTDVQVLHNNAGPRLHTYYGHDETYVLNGDDVPIYAMRDGLVMRARSFESIRSAALPMISRLRATTRKLPVGKPLASMPGIYDITVVNGHPAILSIKSVISPSGQVPQPPGKEIVFISVVRLDGKFLRSLERHYRFDGARFGWTDERPPGEASRAFVSPLNKRVVGYFIWQPFSPGSAVRTDMIAPLLLTLLLVAGLVWLLMRKIGRSTAGFLRQHEISDAALNNMVQGLCMYDGDRRLVTSNRRYAEMYGQPNHLLVPGTPDTELLRYQIEAAFDPARTHDYTHEMIAGVEVLRPHSELELLDGRVVKVRRCALPGGGWVSTHEDITESRKAAQEILYSPTMIR